MVFSYHTYSSPLLFYNKTLSDFEEQQGGFLLQTFPSGRPTRKAKCAICEKFRVKGVRFPCFSPAIRFALSVRESALVSPLPNSACLTNGVMPKKRKWSQVRQHADISSDPVQTSDMQSDFVVFTNLLGFPTYFLRSLKCRKFARKTRTHTLCIYWLERAGRKGMIEKREKAPERIHPARENQARSREIWSSLGSLQKNDWTTQRLWAGSG